LDRKQGVQGGAHTNKQIRSQPGRAVLGLALQADDSAEARREKQLGNVCPNQVHCDGSGKPDLLGF
jgi:hypothetical protein